MTRRRLALLALAAASLAAGAWWLEIERPRREHARLEAASRLLPAEAVIRELRIEHGTPGQSPIADLLSLRPRDIGGWSLTSQRSTRELVADERAVALVLEALREGRAEILEDDASQLSGLAAFGLEPQRLRLSWSTTAGESALVLGEPVPPLARRVYALREGALVTVPREILAASAWGLAHFRNKLVLGFAWEDLEGLRIERGPGRGAGASPVLELRRDAHPQGRPTDWRLALPLDAPARPAPVRAMLSHLSRLLAVGFGPEDPSFEELVEAGLSPPALQVEIQLRGGRRHLLQLGDEPEEPGPVPARLDEGPIVMLRPELRRTLAREDDAYRENRAFPLEPAELVSVSLDKGEGQEGGLHLELHREADGTWHASRPAHGALPADEVARFLEALGTVQFGRFEDAIAAEPGGFERAFEARGPDSFRIEGRAIGAGGAASWITMEAAPVGSIMQERTPYRPVAVRDRADRITVGVAAFRAFDPVLERARLLRDLALEEGLSPPPEP